MPKPSEVDLSGLTKLHAADVRLLWVNDWYDGPLEAVVERGGERLLMVLRGEGPPMGDDETWQWLLYPLTKEQWAEEDRWHRLFEEHVGHHWCFHHEAPLPEPEKRSPELFYGPYKSRAPLDLDANEPVAWMDEMPAK